MCELGPVPYILRMGLTVSFLSRMRDIPEAEWNSLSAGYDTPLLSWGYLALLEESGSMVPEMGWIPAHFILRREGRLIAAAPLYLRTHSWGDYVFDFEWAEVAEAMKIDYYPKLVGVVPATPVPVWRILADPGEDETEIARIFDRVAWEVCAEEGLSGVNLLFCDPAWIASVGEGGYAAWRHQSFLWTNEGYADFPGYLDSFSKNMRRNVIRERRSVEESGIEVRMVHGADDRMRTLMADYYEDTNGKFGPWAARFLTRDFFLRIGEFLPEGPLYGAAFEPGERDPVALSFFLEGKKSLVGRFWGSARRVDGLHFETCYYTPIEYAIGKGISSFDPGAGSEHKIRRGFRAVTNTSLHRFRDKRLDSLFRRYLPQMNLAEDSRVIELNRELPFKRGGTPMSG